MADGQGRKDRRGLRLERETLRDLAPSAADARAVRGGESSTCLGRENCLVLPEAVNTLLGRTMMSWGCVGRIEIIFTERGQEILLDLQPNQATLELKESIQRSLEK